MPATTKAEANALIDKLRRKNGGLTTEQRQRLERTEPELLEMFDSIKLTLGAATKTCVERAIRLVCKLTFSA